MLQSYIKRIPVAWVDTGLLVIYILLAQLAGLEVICSTVNILMPYFIACS